MHFHTFDFAKFDTAYNAIIGRTALVKFMAVSHYAYQVLKMPRPKGTITIQGNAKLAVQCDKRSLDMVGQTSTRPEQAFTFEITVRRVDPRIKPGGMEISQMVSRNAAAGI